MILTESLLKEFKELSRTGPEHTQLPLIFTAGQPGHPHVMPFVRRRALRAHIRRLQNANQGTLMRTVNSGWHQ